MTPQTIQIILAFSIGFLLGFIVVGRMIVRYTNRKDNWLDDDL